MVTLMNTSQSGHVSRMMLASMFVCELWWSCGGGGWEGKVELMLKKKKKKDCNECVWIGVGWRMVNM